MKNYPKTENFPPEVSRTELLAVEGRVHELGLQEKFQYLLKYLFRHHYRASLEAQDFFQRQKLLNAFLKKNPSPPPLTKLTAVGDIMWIRSNWDNLLSDGVRSLLDHDGFVLGNLETPLSDRFPHRSWLPDRFNYSSPTKYLHSFRRANGTPLFSALSFANNHTYDYGEEGALHTLEALQAEGIPPMGIASEGAEAPLTILHKPMGSLGIYAATFGFNEMSWVERSPLRVEVVPGLAPWGRKPLELKKVKQALSKMEAAKVQGKVVFLHWGSEFDYFPRAQQVQTALELVKLGADLVLGSHPHVAQPPFCVFVNGAEKGIPNNLVSSVQCIEAPGPPRTAWVAPSLGNFSTAMLTVPCRLGYAFHFPFTGRREEPFLVPQISVLWNQGPSLLRPRKLLLWEEAKQRLSPKTVERAIGAFSHL